MNSPAVTPAPLQLALGEEELLVERAIRAALDSARLADPSADLTRVRVADLTSPELAELVSPSLFAEGRVIVVDAAHEATQDIAAVIISYVKNPAEGIVFVVVHNGGGRKAGKDIVAAMRKAGAVVTECAKITKPAEREAFVRNEIRRAGGKTDAAAVAALVDSVGSDLRELAAASAQLVADTAGAVTEEAVRRYHRGRADVTGFAVAEKAVTGDVPGALEALRWAMHLGVPHVLVADALADAVRTVARVSGAGRADPFRLAGELGMPAWKVKKALAQSRGWKPAGLVEAMRVVAEVNADVKGVAADADYALERAVLRLAKAHRRE
ncbi:DNA polymerase III, delta subunit [Actinokineospora alba]|uniref:DNA-directed DNA polymerase n=1 Tax=Actinokineospora alba TaxID=504798 RepID=A0A1H0KAA3_9PSEU|nr:DNA polymerase III subunit delta [Actinokineospora alba]TDP67986.1 DNA polymerase III delta subunit [Actinokineospora alba]SDH90212.1 DNA polymerase III, delta subunit [Actinokineospora alba]SDO52682.1 DNA polymerase III, delta subunit [Actinokineospora alba]